MTPEERFNQDVWWILQEIKKDEFLTPKGEKVEFSIRNLSKARSVKQKVIDSNFPQKETQQKLLRKLKEWKAIESLETVDDFLRGSDILDPNIYRFSIKQPEFNNLYQLYEDGEFYSENQKTSVEADNLQSVIKLKSLELIAKEIGEMDNGLNLIEFLVNCGVKRELIEYPNTKWRMVYDILKTYAVSPRIEDNQVLFKIIEESVHPLMHNGDEDVAKKFEDKFCKLIGYDGYAIRDYKIKKISKEAKQDNDLDLYLKKKILVENWRDDLPHPITELSFTKNTMEQICYSLWDLFISDVIYFGANTFPENILIETDPRFHQEIAFNWQLIRDLDNNPHKVDDNYSFDIEVLDEKRLKRNIEEEIEEFIANKVDMSKFEKAKDLYPDTKFFETPSFSRGIPANYYAYKKQRKILLNLIANLYDKFENETLVINFNKINDKNVNVLRTILALEKEGFFTIKELRNDKNEWIDNDNVYAKISIDKKDIPIIKSFKLNNEDKAKTEKNKIDRLPVSESNLGTKEPFKVEVVGLQEGLKALGQSKEDKQIKFPFKLPAGTKWQDFIIKFLDDENISIQVKHIKHNVGYKGMGMVGKGKNPNPSEGWAFLKVLAVVNGELTIKDPEAKDKYKKQKELLAKELQSYFSLDYDPFYPYFSSPEKKGNSYKIKFTLIPPDKLSNETVTDDEEDDSLGIKEAYLEQTPRVYENQ